MPVHRDAPWKSFKKQKTSIRVETLFNLDWDLDSKTGFNLGWRVSLYNQQLPKRV